MSPLHQVAQSASRESHASRSLRVGLMLRAVDDVDGQGVYIRQICEALFRLGPENHYFVYYKGHDQAGRFSGLANVTERVVPSPSKLAWDQVLVPLAARSDRLDVLFHHKFSIPILSPCPTVVQQRGAEYWLHPDFFVGLKGRLDLWYNRMMIPAACRRAARVLTNSDSLADDIARFVKLPRSQISTIYAAADARFRPVVDAPRRTAARRRYGLPRDGFLMMVAKGRQIAGEGLAPLAPRKNIEGTLAAYGALQARLADPPPLVIIGPAIQERLADMLSALVPKPELVHAVGFVAFEDMPALYSMARALVFPSRYESFGIPIIEAMACGCPVITSTLSACPEVAGDAALLVDIDDTAALSDAMLRLCEDEALRLSLRASGLQRAAAFSWERSATQLLDELELAAMARA